MKMVRVLLLLLVFAFGAASAHEDRVLTIRSDGSIPEVPASFGVVVLKISGLGKHTPTVQFSVGSKHNTLPLCVTRLIHTKQLSHIFVTGSWYHDEAILPYYVGVRFYAPGFDSSRSFNSSFNILFNLHTAQVIEIQRFIANPSDSGGQYKDVVLPKGCMSPSMRPNNSVKRTAVPLRGPSAAYLGR